MSTIVTSNISDGTDTVGTEYVVNGSAKAFVHQCTDAGVTSQDLNITSITDNGTGNSTYAFTNSFGAATYGNSASDYNTPRPRSLSMTSIATGSCVGRVVTDAGVSSASAVHSHWWGDLA